MAPISFFVDLGLIHIMNDFHTCMYERYELFYHTHEQHLENMEMFTTTDMYEVFVHVYALKNVIYLDKEK